MADASCCDIRISGFRTSPDSETLHSRYMKVLQTNGCYQGVSIDTSKDRRLHRPDQSNAAARQYGPARQSTRRIAGYPQVSHGGVAYASALTITPSPTLEIRAES